MTTQTVERTARIGGVNLDGRHYARQIVPIWILTSGPNKGMWFGRASTEGYWRPLPNRGRGFATQSFSAHGGSPEEVIESLERQYESFRYPFRASEGAAG